MNKRIAFLVVSLFFAFYTYSQSRIVTNLSGAGWKLVKEESSDWKTEEIFLPPVSINQIPVHPPVGGWSALNNNALPVNVPGTAEEYLQKVSGPDGDIKGVSWWYRDIAIPANANGQKILLRFESARYRSEVFINQQLVGYDLIGNTPFEVDISKYVQGGQTVQLAVRITDPGGNFDWKDGDNITWGKVNVTGSHGFGGITGRVQLVVCNPVYIDDIYIQNTPEYHTVNAIITVNNTTTKEVVMPIEINVSEKNHPEIVRFDTLIKRMVVKPGTQTFTFKIHAPLAKLWDVEHPNLYVCKMALSGAKKGVTIDEDSKTFGFRWFELAGIGKDAMYRLNGKRIVLRTAISWGFWPVNGIFPTPELARKEIATAKSIGLNMLNFHRCIGYPIIMDLADEMGLLFFEEPGNYMAGNKDAFSRACMKEKLCRMVKRDRSHPCMIIYNMQNEMRDVDSTLFLSHKSDMRAAHAIDPSRTITRTSGWALGVDILDQAKLHARPFDTTLYMNGWYDFHRAPGTHTWLQAYYKSPTDYYSYTDNKKEIVYWGEEGALSTPSRIDEIKKSLDKNAYVGWDGAMYADQYTYFKQYFTSKKLSPAFPSIDALTKSMGAISFEHQGRKIENARINNTADGYAINGWESEIVENHSGIVDCYRNPKADPSIIAYYNQPLYIAVKTRKQVVDAGEKVLTDFYIINEKNIKGNLLLNIHVAPKNNPSQIIFSKSINVQVAGGDVYGELLAEAVEIPTGLAGGAYQIAVALTDKEGKQLATGHDEIFTVDWKTQKLIGNGAVLEQGVVIKNFLANQKQTFAETYRDELPALDWLVTSKSPLGGDFGFVPKEQLLDKNGQPGINVSYFNDAKFEAKVAEQTEPMINLFVNEGATPHPKIPATFNYSIRWEGKIVPPTTGTYQFDLKYGYGGNIKLLIDGKSADSTSRTSSVMRINLEAGKAVTLVVELKHLRYTGSCMLRWSVPEPIKIDAQKILDRVKNEGTTLIILDNSDAWMPLIAKNTTIKYTGKFIVGRDWLGGVHFVKAHPLFKDLPVNEGMNWQYEAVVKNGPERMGIELEGEELVAGAYHCFPMKLGTAVGVIPCGKGKIVFSTLEIYNNLNAEESTSIVAKKLLCNYINYAKEVK